MPRPRRPLQLASTRPACISLPGAGPSAGSAAPTPTRTPPACRGPTLPGRPPPSSGPSSPPAKYSFIWRLKEKLRPREEAKAYLDASVEELAGQDLQRDAAPAGEAGQARQEARGPRVADHVTREADAQRAEVVAEGVSHHHLALEEVKDLQGVERSRVGNEGRFGSSQSARDGLKMRAKHYFC